MAGIDFHVAWRGLELAILAVPPALFFWYLVERGLAGLRSKAFLAFVEERGFAYAPGENSAFRLSGLLAEMPVTIAVEHLEASLVTRVLLRGPWVETGEAERDLGALVPKRAVLAPYAGRDPAPTGMNAATIMHAGFDGAFRGHVDSVTTVAPWAIAKVRDAMLALQAVAPIRQVIVTETECSIALDGIVRSPRVLERALEVAALLVGYRLKRARTATEKRNA